MPEPLARRVDGELDPRQIRAFAGEHVQPPIRLLNSVNLTVDLDGGDVLAAGKTSNLLQGD
jgi:hypothetical protein